MRIPEPRTAIFDGRAPGLGVIAGPLRVDVVGDCIWAAGLGRVLHHAGRWTAHDVSHRTNFIIGLDAESAIAGGSDGRIGRTDDAGATWTWHDELPGGHWLICGSRDAAGRIWVGQQGGNLWRSLDGRSYARVATLDSTVNAARPISPAVGLVCTEHALYRLDLASGTTEVAWKQPDANLIDAVADERGGVLVVADGGRAWYADALGATPRAVDCGAGSLNLDAAFRIGGHFVVLGYDGALRVSTDATTWQRVPVETAVQRLGGIAAYAGGWLVGGHRSSQLGTLAFLGDPARAPLHAYSAPAVDTDFVPPAARSPEARERRHAELLATFPPAAPRADANPALAQQLDDHDDDSVLAVYADWLQSVGDPRGELAALQLAPSNLEAVIAQVPLQDQHAHLFGVAAALEDVAEVRWSGGFWQAIRIANVEDEIDLEEALGELLDEPSARFLRSLTVGIVTREDNSYDGIARVIGERYLPALRTLVLGKFSSEETELNWSNAGDISPIYAAAPNLARLSVRSGSMTLGAIALPRLERFEVITGGLDGDAARAIAAARWPSLRELAIQVGRPSYGGTATIADLLPILDGDELPRLVALGLANLEFTDALIGPFAMSRMLPQLERLDLQMGTMSDDGARELVRYQRAFAHLAELNVNDNYLSADAQRMLACLPCVRFGGQREDDGARDRQASAVE